MLGVAGAGSGAALTFPVRRWFGRVPFGEEHGKVRKQLGAVNGGCSRQ